MKDLIKSFPELQYQMRVSVLNEYFVWLLFIGIYLVFYDLFSGFLFLGLLFSVRYVFQCQLEKHSRQSKT